MRLHKSETILNYKTFLSVMLQKLSVYAVLYLYLSDLNLKFKLLLNTLTLLFIDW